MNLRTLALVSSFLQSAAPLPAAVLTVTTLADSGPGSLRDTVALSVAGDTIRFNVTGTITLSSAITIALPVSVLGPGPSALSLDGNHICRIFVTSGSPLLIAGMTLRNGLVVGANGADGTPGQNGAPGLDASGGAILNSGGLTLSNCWVTGNVAQGGIGGKGGDNPLGAAFTPGTGGTGGPASYGGIASSIGSLENAINCTFSANQAIGGTGGVGGDNLNFAVLEPGGTGGIGGAGSLSVMTANYLTNCTFSDNASLGGVGGQGGSTSATFIGGHGGTGGDGSCGAVAITDISTVISCTIVSNSAVGGTGGGGGAGTPLGNHGAYGSGTVGAVCGYFMTCLPQMGNTIVADNFASTMYLNIHERIYDLGFNYFGDNQDPGPCIGALSRMGTVASPLHPQLGPLAQNGGGLPTHPPLPGSPVIDWGYSFGTTNDERGAPRPYGSAVPGSGGDGSDVGAVEFGSTALNLAHSGTGVVISWPGYYGDFTLQSATRLEGAGNWRDVTNPPVLIENRFIVTNNATGPRKFFRLMSR